MTSEETTVTLQQQVSHKEVTGNPINYIITGFKVGRVHDQELKDYGVLHVKPSKEFLFIIVLCCVLKGL